jgi:hypothetical protein
MAIREILAEASRKQLEESCGEDYRAGSAKASADLKGLGLDPAPVL